MLLFWKQYQNKKKHYKTRKQKLKKNRQKTPQNPFTLIKNTSNNQKIFYNLSSKCKVPNLLKNLVFFTQTD